MALIAAHLNAEVILVVTVYGLFPLLGFPQYSEKEEYMQGFV